MPDHRVILASIEYGVPAWAWREYPHIIILSWAISIVFMMWAVFACLGLHTENGGPSHLKKRQ